MNINQSLINIHEIWLVGCKLYIIRLSGLILISTFTMNVSRLLFVLLILLVVCSFLAEGGKKDRKKNRNKKKKKGGKKNGGKKKTGNGKDNSLKGNLTDMMAGCKFILLFCTSLMPLTFIRTPFICSPFISYHRISCKTWRFVSYYHRGS